MFRKNLGTRLRETAGHDDAGIGIGPARAARNAQAFAVRAIGNGAGVDDIDVGGFVELAAIESERAEARLDDGRIVLVDLATESGNRKPHRARLLPDGPFDKAAAHDFITAIKYTGLAGRDRGAGGKEANFGGPRRGKIQPRGKRRMPVANLHLDFGSRIKGCSIDQIDIASDEAARV